jgi:CcmD family protein
MFYGFAAAWLIIFIYVLTLVRRGQRLQRSMDDMERLGSAG